jgi:hypothetical protein
MTNEVHNKYLAWAFIAHGTFQILITLLMAALLALAFPVPADPGETPPVEFLLIMFGFIFAFQSLLVAPSFIAAFALFKRKSWARVASIVAGVVSAMNVPFGTLTCIYSLWYFLGENWRDVYLDGVGSMAPQQIAQNQVSRWSGYHTNEKGEIVFQPFEPPDWR